MYTTDSMHAVLDQCFPAQAHSNTRLEASQGLIWSENKNAAHADGLSFVLQLHFRLVCTLSLPLRSNGRPTSALN